MINGIIQLGFPTAGGCTLFYENNGITQCCGVEHVNGRMVLGRFDTTTHAATDWTGGRVVIGCYADIRTIKHFHKYKLEARGGGFRTNTFSVVTEAEYNRRNALLEEALAEARCTTL